MTKPNRAPNETDPICALASCQKHFVPRIASQRYCDNKCRGESMVTKVTVTCTGGCGKTEQKRPDVLHADGTWTCITCANQSRRTDELERFDSYAHGEGVEMRAGLEACVHWTGTLDKDDYGVFTLSGQDKQVRADRYAWNLAHPDAPLRPDQKLRHDCDNPPCIRMSHLRTGSNADNTQDMVDRDRQARGVRMAAAILNDERVAAIRTDYATGKYTQQELADREGVSQFTISQTVRGKRWRHVQ